MTNKNYGKRITGLLGAWFLVSLSASALHLFRGDPSRPPLPLGLAVLTPLVIFAVWFGYSQEFRRFVLSLNPRTLTFIQTWRTEGFTFLVLYTYGILPGVFALPAGWGDIAIGVTAPLIALNLVNSAHRRAFVLWNVIGVIDLVTAVTMGTTAYLIAPHAAATTALTELPLSLIPTFAVPLFLILHAISIAQARTWNVSSDARLRLAAA
jgi:hypothetical protein